MPQADYADAVSRFSSPQETGMFLEDCELGRRLADELIQDAKVSGRKSLLCDVVVQLVSAGRCSAVQVGFFHRIMQHATG